MKVGLVYRGYTHDVVSRPGYNGSVSATSRTDSTPRIQPDQHHPIGKDITSQTIQQQKSVQDWSNEVSLKGWQQSDPFVTNFAQQVMAVNKLREGRKGLELDDRPSGWQPVTSVGGDRRPETEVRHDDQGIYSFRGDFLESDRLYVDESLVHNDHIRMERDTFRIEQSGRDTTTFGFYQLPAHLPLWSPEKEAKYDLDPTNATTAPSQWDQRDYSKLFLDIDEAHPTSGNPEISLGFDTSQARQALRLDSLSQELMTAEKIREGTVPINSFDPENPEAERGSQVEPAALNQSVNGPREEGVRLMAENAREAPDAIEVLHRLETGGTPEADSNALLRGPIELQVGPGGDAQPYAAYGSGGVDIQIQGADRALKLKADLAQLNLALYTHHFGHDQIVPEDRTNRFQYDLIAGRQDLIVIEKPQNRYQVKGPRLESLPMAVGLDERKVYSQQVAPIPLYPSSKDEFTLQMSPFYQGINAEDTYKVDFAPGLDRVKYGYQDHPRTPRNVWDINSIQEEREDLLYTERLPFSDELDLDKEYGRPEFPSETIVVNKRSDIPFGHRSNLRTERERDLVPDIPIGTDRTQHHEIAVENVRKDVDNMRSEHITENQLYGRDHSRLTEIINLEQIKELDKFEYRIDYLEGRHTPPIARDPQDLIPPNVRALSLEDVVWGWNHKDQE